MVQRFLMLIPRGKTRPSGAIPIRKNTSRSTIKKALPGILKAGFKVRIVSKEQLKRIILKVRPKSRRTKKKRRRR